ncbi:MAG: FAD-dependent oxidoreductase [Thauera sp.]|nr:FAD-dependent oxidoreductase [Thauera sp.]
MADVDLVIVGAGIQGAGVAQAAAAAGHSVLMLEQTGIASGTSSRSSKLIHGGLRYLESGQFALVRECLRERAVLLRNAPGLVRLVPHHIPVYQETRRRPAWLRAGLNLYALLGGLGSAVRYRSLPREDWSRLDGLRQDGLQAVFRYFDAQTDDAALTGAVVRSAQSLGARLCLPATFTGAAEERGCLCVRYGNAGDETEVRCHALVNAAGPWVDAVLQRVEPVAPGPGMELVAGAHIVLPRRLTRGVYYAESPRDGRAVFIMPWRGDRTLVGTTERAYSGDPAGVAPSDDEIGYLLETVRHYFPDYATLEPEAAFAGVRVLPAGQDSAFARPRDTRLHVTHAGRVVSIYGGKLTAYRATAERVLGCIRDALPQRVARADTRYLPLA